MIYPAFVIGGCRSGKSRYAQDLAESLDGPRVYVATCQPGDDPEMVERVTHHQAQRGGGWSTVETPGDVAGAIGANGHAGVILVDCLTLWVSNLMADGATDGDIVAATRDLTHAMGHSNCPVILVSNEVGTGIVPENDLARRYRDQAGWVNQAVAAEAATVIWTVAGIPVTVKGEGAIR